VPESDRRKVPQPVAWFHDLHQRGLLDLSPSYQRRSVWNQQYRNYFIETLLLNYPAPPVFLHETIDAEGLASYSVVDGKQRLTAIFDFVAGIFPVAEDASIERLQGKSFTDFSPTDRENVWRYQLLVEFLPNVEEAVLTDIFDRLNRNVARLTRQELRHAKFSGEFAKSAESMTDAMHDALPRGFPHIAPASMRQMRDVELVVQLLLLAEAGPHTLSQDELDETYSSRDEGWEQRQSVERRFRSALRATAKLLEAEPGLVSSRLRNQADFYALFGAVVSFLDRDRSFDFARAARKLNRFVGVVSDEARRQRNAMAVAYYEAARSASNDRRQRVARIDVLRQVMSTS
jgi:hypothetical protein